MKGLSHTPTAPFIFQFLSVHQVAPPLADDGTRIAQKACDLVLVARKSDCCGHESSSFFRTLVISNKMAATNLYSKSGSKTSRGSSVKGVHTCLNHILPKSPVGSCICQLLLLLPRGSTDYPEQSEAMRCKENPDSSDLSTIQYGHTRCNATYDWWMMLLFLMAFFFYHILRSYSSTNDQALSHDFRWLW